MNKQKILVNRIKENCLKNNDGITLDFKGYIVNKNNGYYVSITKIKGRNLNLMIKRILFIKKYAFNQVKENMFIGFWRDRENNKYLDLSLYILIYFKISFSSPPIISNNDDPSGTSIWIKF